MAEHEEAYRQGKVGDVAMKRKLVEVLNAFLDPMRMRRQRVLADPDQVLEALRRGTERANVVTEETLGLAKRAMRQDLFSRSLRLR